MSNVKTHTPSITRRQSSWTEDIASFDAKRFAEFLLDSNFIIISRITEKINLLQYKLTMMPMWHTAERIDNCCTKMTT